ncbi:host specificity protein J [Morganella morganii]|uniref:host specificity protein J n=1 Tax=Morganella morganii TaxID=582 RepID=UPI000F485FB2|nr:host specificity protein J [Morganella morganii]ROJ31627.1 host specificity protein [Morganella morganii]
MTQITGRKGGGGSPRTPVEQPDDLQSVAKAKLLIALGEGEFAGELTGKNIFLDGTPLLNADGSENFPGVVWEYRPGTQAQTYIQGMPAAENEITIGTTVQSSTPWAHAFTNPQLSAVRVRLKWPSLFRQEDNGDMVGNEVAYAIDLQTDGGTRKTVVDGRVKGKTTSGYERTHRIDLPQSATSWTLRVRKITEDANSAKIGDTLVLQSYTEVIDAKLTYPHTALLYIEFDSKQFNGSIPQVTCEPKMRVIRIPSNYDPEHRTYSGTWDGSFKWAWTNNPAWVFYDIVISDRFGLGDRIKMQNIDKWELYRVAQYCDQPVPDGKGGSGTEPRYICDVYVQDRNEAYTVLRDFAAIFRGMTYWGGNQIITLADMPRDIDYSYTKANVLDGRFTYSGSSSKARYSSALVSYSDPLNGYADAMEPVFENELVYRFGFNQLEMTAIGCTRQSEANRKGRWGILTNNKDRVVTFGVGLDGNIPQPGYIIAVADENLSGKVTGGRVSAVNGRSITLDRKPDAAPGDRLMLNLPSGKSQARTIQMVTDNVITVTTEYSETPETECVWVTESDELYAQQYRVVSVTENDDGTFTISAAMHDPDKYDRIDTGAVLDERPVSVVPPGNQFPPKDITISSYSVVNQGISIETMQVTWSPAENAIAYEAQWRRDDGNWINVPRNATTSFDVPGVYSGRYLVRVRAINAAEISSGWGYSEETRLTGKAGDPPVPVGFAATGINWGIALHWGFPSGTGDTLKTEIQYTANTDYHDPLLLSDVPYPMSEYTQLGLKAGQSFFYRARLVDKTGNQGGWTDWIHGQPNSDASDYLNDIADEFMSAEDGHNLTSEIDMNTEAIISNALADDANVRAWHRESGAARADILETRKIIADEDKALAEYKQVVAARFEENEAAIENRSFAEFDSNGNGSAIFSVRAGVNHKGQYYDAGMTVGVTVSGTKVSSRIGFSADQFVLLNKSNDSWSSPFSVYGGQVFINSALIQDASITSAKISGAIQSDNFVSGKTGWRLDKNGTFEMNGSFGGQSRVQITNAGMSVWDEAGILRTKLGRL